MMGRMQGECGVKLEINREEGWGDQPEQEK